MKDFCVGRAVPIGNALPSIKNKFQHSAETIPQLQDDIKELYVLTSKILVRLHNIENRGRDE